MSILFVLLMFLLVMSISYFRSRAEVVAVTQTEAFTKPLAPHMQRANGFAIPEGYAFHPGHTWVVAEGGENARVGLDSFAANLLGTIERVEVTAANRWVRQGQKLATLVSGGQSFDLVSPVEGVVTAVNRDLAQDPGLLANEPYQAGWIALVKSPDLSLNKKNLVQGPMVAPWLQNNVTRLNGMVAQLAPTMAADGGLPLRGLITRVTPEVREKLAKEFFLA
ncbi:MAG TPA: glycine cleavage system protein H [Terriglobales bacterium]|nr:glycine cleavage system protein H [Terriglobales bacterium]